MLVGKPGDPDIHVVTMFLSVAALLATERNGTVVLVRGWCQRLFAHARTGSGMGLPQVPGDAAAALKYSAVINPRLSTPTGTLFCECPARRSAGRSGWQVL